MLKKASDPSIPQYLDAAMLDIEAENPRLKGVLYREFGRLEMPPGKIGELVEIIGRMKFDPDNHGSRDIFGEVYEYLLGMFALSEGAKAGEFYTPKSVVNMLVEILAPFKGKIYDPTCGSGGMFVQSERFKEASQKKLKRKGDLVVYGQELMADTRRLCLMNLAVHGIEGDIGSTYASTLTDDQHKSLRADYVLANPPFNISDWSGETLRDDPRWVYGVPPARNANYAFFQHILARLSKRGRAAVVMANGTMTSTQGGEDVIRRNMILDDVVECVVALPAQLFSNASVPACIWFFSKDKKSGVNGSADRTGQILFIDARKLASGRISRTQIEFLEEEIHRIAMIYHRWRGTEFGDGGSYEDAPGLCSSRGLEETVQANVLTPGFYVGAEAMDDNHETFNLKMERLSTQLSEHMAKGARLDAVFREKLGGMGYVI
jgi:type I restriction enzyme M protein